MFEDDEDEEDFEMTELEKWYDDNFPYFRRESKTETGVNLDISLFYTGVYLPALKEIAPAIRKLMLHQYPIIDGENRPLVVDYINWAISRAGHRLLMNLNILVQDQKEGIDQRVKFPDFENWIDFYARPAEPPVPDYHFFEKYPDLNAQLSEEQKKEIAEEGMEDRLFYFHKNEQLKKEYYDIVQPIVLKYYKALEELDYDGWIIFAVQIREDYEDYKYRCEHLETFIEYGFEEEDINLNYKEFMEKFNIKYNEKRTREGSSNDSEKST